MLSIHELTKNDEPPVNLKQSLEQNEHLAPVDGLKSKLIKVDMTDDATDMESDDIEGANSEDAQVLDSTSRIDVSIIDILPKTSKLDLNYFYADVWMFYSVPSTSIEGEDSTKKSKPAGISPMTQLISWLRTSGTLFVFLFWFNIWFALRLALCFPESARFGRLRLIYCFYVLRTLFMQLHLVRSS